VRKTTLFVAAALTALVCGIGLTQSARGHSVSAPAGLSTYGGLIWNLDALVHDHYGGDKVCMRARRFAIHRCRSANYNDGDYRATFATARHSHFRALARSSNPLRLVNVVPITISGRYIECEAARWLAITNVPAGWGEAVYCVKP
jgi:hypothetical protein